MTGLVLARDDEGVRSTTTIAKGGEEREREELAVKAGADEGARWGG